MEQTPYCDCEGCRKRTEERLRTADDSALRHMIGALQAHLAEKKDEVKRG